MIWTTRLGVGLVACFAGSGVAVGDAPATGYLEADAWLAGAPSAEARTGWEPVPLNISGTTNERDSEQKYENHARIAVNSAGDAMVVWQTELESGVYARRFDVAAGRWDDAVAELAPPEEDDSDVRVAIDEQGNAMVMWESDGGDGRLRATRYSAADGQWDPLPTVLSDRGGSFARLEMDGAGDATAVWQGAGEILARRYNGQSRQWNARSMVLSKHGGKAALPELAVNRDGDAVVVWSVARTWDQEGSSQPYAVHARRFAAGSARWEAVEVVARGREFHHPRVGIDARGNAVVAWQQFDGGGKPGKIVTRRFDAGAERWRAPVTLFSGTKTSRYQDIALEANGNATVIWLSGVWAQASWALWARRYDAGAARWSQTTRLAGGRNEGPISNHRDVLPVQLEMAANGDAFLAWHAYNRLTRNTAIWAMRFDMSGRRWQRAPMRLSADASNAQYPGMAFDGKSRGFAVWTAWGSVHARTEALRYRSSGLNPSG